MVIPDKRYFKIGEVCDLTGVKPHVLRYWESEFKVLNPQRANSRQRLYRRVDVEIVLSIRRLLKEEGFTITGAKKVLTKKFGGVQREVAAPAAVQPPAHHAVATCPEGMMAEIKRNLLALKKMLEEQGAGTGPA
ncbi:MAG: MerR family transcriptional regulator [Thermodesulfobacteriota bacterium]